MYNDASRNTGLTMRRLIPYSDYSADHCRAVKQAEPTGTMKLSTTIDERHLKQPFRISGEVWYSTESVVVTLQDGNMLGRGEAQGVSYLGETVATMLDQIAAATKQVEGGISRIELLDVLPSGGARNAIDCALWDLEAKRSGKSIWELTEIQPEPVQTVFTIGLESTPEAMADKAKAASCYPVLKVKLDQNRPVERLAAIRNARPDAVIVVDVNQGWTFAQLLRVLPTCEELNISMVEQPLPRGADKELEGFTSPVTLAADESCLDSKDLDQACRRYSMINIKLDKTGGLTEALRLAQAAKERGCKLMVGNMVGTSLSMAPSFVLAQLCDFADLDGPLLLQDDYPGGLRYSAGSVQVFDRGFWG
jgi:L-alanine-DL-glutamate epimerase-like enolase superfamily enzyme